MSGIARDLTQADTEMQQTNVQPWHLFLLISLVKVPSAWQMASILFIAPENFPGSYRCRDHQSLTEFGISDPCNTYIRKNITVINNGNYFTSEEMVLCEDFEFLDDHYSIVDQWQLVCQKKILVTVSQFFYLVGVWLGGITCTFLLYIRPPEFVLISGMLVQVIAGTGVAFTPFFVLHCGLRLLTAVGCTLMFTCGYAICTRIVKGKGKLVAGCCYEHLWSVGVITLPCIAYMFSDWRYFQLAISLPTTALILCFRAIPKCPGWSPKKTVSQKIIVAVIKIPPTMGKKGSEGTLELEQSSLKESNVFFDTTSKIFRRKIRYAALHTIWACTLVTYYGGLLNVKSLGSQLFMSTVCAGMAEIAGTLLGLSLLLKSADVWLTLGKVNISGGLACILSWVLPNDVEGMQYVLLSLAMFGRIAIATCLTIITIRSRGVFADGNKDSGMFTCVTLGRAILLLAPFIGNLADIGRPVPLTVFGTFTLLAGLSSLLLAAVKADDHVDPEITDDGCYRLKSPAELEKKENRTAA